jgi:hypothetical protein
MMLRMLFFALFKANAQYILSNDISLDNVHYIK